MARVAKHEAAKSLLDSLSEALVVLDPALVVLEWNALMERLTGVQRTDAVGRNAETVLPLFRDPMLVPLVRRALAGESLTTIEMPYVAPGDARPLWIEVRCVPWRDDEGRVAGVAAFLADVRDPQRRALLLHATQALGQSLTSPPALHEVLHTIVGKALEFMGAASAMVVLGAAGAAEYRVMRAAGRLSGEYAVVGTIPVGGGPISLAVREGRT